MVLNFFWFQFSDSESEDGESESVQESNDSDDYSKEVMLIKVIFVIILFQNSSKFLPPIFSWPQSMQVGRPRGTVLHLGWGGGPKYLSKGMES